MIQQVFRRQEIKYILTPHQYDNLMSIIEPYLVQDRYFKGTNCSIYYDTSTRYLAVHSLESPLYKEKFRLRCYNTPTLDDIVFIEIKQKYDGVGNKRRVPIKLQAFYDYTNKHPCTFKTDNPQIDAELSYRFNFYHLEPAVLLAYDRTSYCSEDDSFFRVTFDANVRSRTDDLRLELGDHGESYFKNGEIVMEVKVLNRYPFWFVRALSRLKIYPTKFSKYGRIMQKLYPKIS